MCEIITHVPITPRVNSETEVVPLGFYNLPNQARLIAALLKLPYTLSMNTLGTSDGSSLTNQAFIADLSNLGINPEKVWKDEVEAPVQINEIVSAGLNNGWIEKKRSEIMTCAEKGCGKSEFLHISSGLPIRDTKHSTIYQDNGDIFCKLCGTHLEREKVESLIWNVPDLLIDDVSIYPDYARKEIQANLRDISGKGFLITRSSKRDLEFNSGGSTFWLDTDFSNYTFLGMLHYSGDIVNTLITGRNIHRQTALMLALNQALGLPNPRNVVSSSKITVDWGTDENGIRKHDQSLDQLLASGCLPKSIRLFLLQAIGSLKKDISLKSSDIHFTDLALNKLPPMDLSDDLSVEDLFKQPLRAYITKMLKMVRRGNYDQLDRFQRVLTINCLPFINESHH